MGSPTIDLTAVDNYEVDGRTITVTSDTRTTRYVLPSGARISKWDGEKRSRLEIGGYKAVTVSVLGPPKVIAELFEFLA